MPDDLVHLGVLDIDGMDERLWVPQPEGVTFRPLLFSASQGYFVNLLRVRRSGIVSRHRQAGPVHGLTLRARWHYLEHPWWAEAGGYSYEPPGDIHTLEVPDDVDEMVALFHAAGACVYVRRARLHRRLRGRLHRDRFGPSPLRRGRPGRRLGRPEDPLARPHGVGPSPLTSLTTKRWLGMLRTGMRPDSEEDRMVARTDFREARGGEPNVDTSVRDPALVAARRAEICRAAVVLARRVPFGAVTTREIAAEAGINIATVYQYVRSKDDIVFLVCQQNVRNLQDELSASEAEPVRRLRSRFSNLMLVMQDRQMEITFVYQESRNLTGDYRQAVKDWDELVVDHFEEPLRAAHELGTARVENTRVAARHMVETGYAWANKSWSLRRTVSNAEYRDVHWRWFERAFDLRPEQERA